MPASNSKQDKLNSRQHRFCLNILAGMSPQEAYINAGYSPNSADCEAYTLQTSPSVAKFLQEQRHLKEAVILANSVNDTIATPTERKQILTELLRARLADFLDDDGQPKLTKDTPNNRAAKEFTHYTRTDRNGNLVVTKGIKLTDIISAIQELNKMDGSYAPQRHLVGHVDIEVEHVDEIAGRKKIPELAGETSPVQASGENDDK